MKALVNNLKNGPDCKNHLAIFDRMRFFGVVFVGMVACWLVSQMFSIATVSPFAPVPLATVVPLLSFTTTTTLLV